MEEPSESVLGDPHLLSALNKLVEGAAELKQLIEKSNNKASRNVDGSYNGLGVGVVQNGHGNQPTALTTLRLGPADPVPDWLQREFIKKAPCMKRLQELKGAFRGHMFSLQAIFLHGIHEHQPTGKRKYYHGDGSDQWLERYKKFSEKIFRAWPPAFGDVDGAEEIFKWGGDFIESKTTVLVTTDLSGVSNRVSFWVASDELEPCKERNALRPPSLMYILKL
ncbi:hypothetical protein N7532_002624 [Penicillium argentinense]|uniref:Uncharacterized protein n=1 Tax=Penicillium argentinense TaxID=1131581 RepID=A0A9W9KKE8_9EURO|nr:uncharacterized protein N7532_002624 [Penicillium argentinense]KAJ5109979.1 hypothetical protein N7532_002624 [Penicillium argentinense]